MRGKVRRYYDINGQNKRTKIRLKCDGSQFEFQVWSWTYMFKDVRWKQLQNPFSTSTAELVQYMKQAVVCLSGWEPYCSNFVKNWFENEILHSAHARQYVSPPVRRTGILRFYGKDFENQNRIKSACSDILLVLSTPVKCFWSITLRVGLPYTIWWVKTYPSKYSSEGVVHDIASRYCFLPSSALLWEDWL